MEETIHEKKKRIKREYYARHRIEILARMKKKYDSNENGIADRKKEYARNTIRKDRKTDAERKLRQRERHRAHYSLYFRWKNMMRRCYDKTNRSYPRYGERGVHVVAPLNIWSEYKKHILSLVDNENDIFGNHIDRIDNNGNYEIGNLRVVSVKDNLENSSNTKNNPSLKRSII